MTKTLGGVAVGFSEVYQGTQRAVRNQELSRETAGDGAAPAVDNLENAFSRLRQKLPTETQVDFRLLVQGKSRELNPAIRQQAYRIGREALLNAFRHAGASRIEVDLEYASARFRIAVRDDGKGIVDGLFHSERKRYRGLIAMRELAQGMGAKLKVMSRAAAGTEIELSIPGHIAFASDRKASLLRWRMPEAKRQQAG